MLRFFDDNNDEDFRVQMDVRWSTYPNTRIYYTSSRVNFGVFLVKASDCTAAVRIIISVSIIISVIIIIMVICNSLGI